MGGIVLSSIVIESTFPHRRRSSIFNVLALRAVAASMSAYIPRPTASGIIVVLFIVTIDSADGSEDESNRNIGLSIDLEMIVWESDDEDPPVEVTIGFFPPSDGFDAADDACIAWSMAGFSPWDDTTSSIDDGFRFFAIIESRFNDIEAM